MKILLESDPLPKPMRKAYDYGLNGWESGASDVRAVSPQEETLSNAEVSDGIKRLNRWTIAHADQQHIWSLSCETALATYRSSASPHTHTNPNPRAEILDRHIPVPGSTLTNWPVQTTQRCTLAFLKPKGFKTYWSSSAQKVLMSKTRFRRAYIPHPLPVSPVSSVNILN